MANKTYNNQSLADDEKRRRFSVQVQQPPSVAGLRQAQGDSFGEPTTDELLAGAKDALRSSDALAARSGLAAPYEMARSEDFTDPTRTMFQEMGKQAGRVGNAAILPSLIPGLNSVAGPIAAGGYGLQALQQMISPFEAEGESELGGVGSAALAAIPYANRMRKAAMAVPVRSGAVPFPSSAKPASARMSSFPRVSNAAAPKPSGGENLRSYFAGETPQSIIRRGKPGQFVTPEKYQSQHALEGLQRAGERGKTNIAKRAVEKTTDVTMNLDDLNTLSPLDRAARFTERLRRERPFVKE